jgi:hypothetical protein
MFATATSIEEDRFVAVDSAFEQIPPTPPDFDPTARTLR